MSTTSSDIKPIQQEEITARARDLWQKSGSPEGRNLEFWLAAEHELNREREDVKETNNGVIDSPPRSTPGGGEKTTPTSDNSPIKTAKKARGPAQVK